MGSLLLLDLVGSGMLVLLETILDGASGGGNAVSDGNVGVLSDLLVNFLGGSGALLLGLLLSGGSQVGSTVSEIRDSVGDVGSGVGSGVDDGLDDSSLLVGVRRHVVLVG